VDGNPTSTTINNDDGSQTTTTVTPVTTTTTETTVTQTNRDAELTSLQSQMKTSAGRATFNGWTINSFGSSIGASPTEGLMTGGNANVTTTITNDQLFGNDVNSTEAGQGFSFSYGANVDNNQGEGDAWQITLNIFNSANTQLGTSTISGNSFHGSTTMTGLLDINAGNIVDYATLNLIGTGATSGGSYLTGARFNDMFTSFLYNEIESSISTATTYETLVATVSCDILNTCVVADTTSDDIATGALDLSSDTSVADTAINAPAEIAEIAQLPSGGSDTGTTATATAEPVAPTIASLKMEASPEAAAEVAAEQSVEADIEAEVDNNQSQTTENQTEANETDSNNNNDKSGSKSASVRSESDDKSEEGDAKSAKSNSVNKKPMTKAEKRKAKQKAAQKIVKKMGDKGRYNDASQITTLVVMQVLGNTKDFFSSQQKLQDTPNFFTSATVPDNSISDNNYTSYFLFGGADQAHNALIEGQYRR